MKKLFTLILTLCLGITGVNATNLPADVLNSAVTPKSIGKTICVVGYTGTIRPSTYYTNKIKTNLMKQAGLDVSHIADYELDHNVPLALGGNATNVSNLKLQSRTGADDAGNKDVLERKLQCLVCSKQVPLRVAQKDIYTEWHKAASKYSSMSCKRPTK